MTKEEFSSLYNASPALQMLRMRNAHWVLPFLFGVFKEENRFSIPGNELVQVLADLLANQDGGLEDAEDVIFAFGEDDASRSRKYIQLWVQRRLLQDLPASDGSTIYQLSAHTEKVFQWVQTLQLRQHVGTESRFKLLFNSLRDIVENTEDDRAKRLETLKQKRAELDKEIKALELGVVPDRYNNAQVSERLELFTQLCYTLISDFREVEDNFKQIHRAIVEQHTKESYHKGDILGFAFEAYDALRSSNQGKSFYAFWDFLVSRAGQEEWRELTGKLLEILRDRQIDCDEHFLSDIKSMLLEQGKAVYESNDKMAEKLSRIVTEREIARHRRLRKQIGQIKELVFELMEEDDVNCGMEWEDAVEIKMTLDRKISLEQKNTVQEARQPADAHKAVADFERLGKMLNTRHVDKKILWGRVQEVLISKQTATLKEVLEVHPLENGLADIIAYFSFLKDKAAHAYIVNNTTEHIPLNSEATKFIEVPYLLFGK
ncbi:hypothetical protein COR50_00185 [Chitinophaga caeni]|uniref:DUF3375 domain-containing protein n=1 Tax=Chitinophaga caeni TaxID=2029983 RepID=A0A291QP97_9BACT|nr:DUF3375 domain-containing protein [Chitinophaga caeni]ATL45702.1 hypothetical protein COR50_00185 [Chitinophaga caeni]